MRKNKGEVERPGKTVHRKARPQAMAGERTLEMALAREKLTLDHLIEFNPFPVLLCDRAGYPVRFNKALVDLFGAPPPRQSSLFQDGGLRQKKTTEEIKQVMDGLVTTIEEHWLDLHELDPALPSKRVCVCTTVIPLRYGPGEIENYLLMFNDLTPHKRCENISRCLFNVAHAVNTTSTLADFFVELHLSLSAIIDTTNFFVALLDQEKNEIYFPYFVDEKDQHFVITNAQDSGSLTAEVITTQRPLLLHQAEILQRYSSGDKKPWGTISRAWLAVPLKLKGRVIGALGVQSYQREDLYSAEDIDILESVAEYVATAIDSAKANQALRESEQRYRAFYNNTPVMMCSIDRRGHLVSSSNFWLESLGYKRWEMIGRNSTDFMTESSRLYAEVSLYPQLFREGHCKDIPCQFVKKSGEVLDVLLSAIAERDSTGEISRCLAVLIDVTEQKKVEEARRRLEEQLNQAQKMEAIGLLAGGVAHDFNNLLTGILGYANLLKIESSEGSSAFEAARTIEKAAERATDLTRQLIGFARRGRHRNIAVDMHAIVDEVVTLLSRSIDKRIRLRRCLEATCSVVLGDPVQIQQAVLNIAVNARDAMPQGGDLTFETRSVLLNEVTDQINAGLQPGPYVTVTISDTGQGIQPEHLNRIFEPFFTTKERDKGSGMGLAMVYGIVKNHCGAVMVSSTVGKGSVFTIYLPAAEGMVAEAESSAATKAPRGTGLILLVDDEEVVRLTAAEMLRRAGYTVVSAGNGQEAVEYFQQFSREIDLVIIDMVMPVMDGQECFRELRRINPGVRAVLSTGYELNGKALEIVEEGAAGFIQKPYLYRDLTAVVHQALNQER